jgi:hypothetical protein
MVFDPPSIQTKCPKLLGNRFFSHEREGQGEGQLPSPETLTPSLSQRERGAVLSTPEASGTVPSAR